MSTRTVSSGSGPWTGLLNALAAASTVYRTDECVRGEAVRRTRACGRSAAEQEQKGPPRWSGPERPVPCGFTHDIGSPLEAGYG